MKGFRNIDDLYWKYMLAYKRRTIFTILGITLAVILFFGAGTIYTSIYQALFEKNKAEFGNFDAYGMINPEEYQTMKELDYIDEILLYQWNNLVYTELEEVETQVTISYMEKFQSSIFEYELLEGRWPENDEELLLDEDTADFLGVVPGDFITTYYYEYWHGSTYIGDGEQAYEYIFELRDKGDNIKIEDLDRKKFDMQFQVVGIYKSNTSLADIYVDTSPMLSLMDKERSYSYLDVCVRFKQHENHIDELAKEEGIYLQENSDVTAYIKGYDSSEVDPLLEYILFVMAFAILFWIAVIIIRNVFVMTMAERAKDYGILRCMGISQFQLRRMLCKEGFAMAAIACVLGISITVLMIEFGKYIGGFQQLLKLIGIFETFHASISPWMVLGSVAFTFCAVLFSLLEPARQIGAIAPVDAIIGRTTIKKERIKRRRGGLIRKIFGVEGEYAYKNLLRNKGKFIASMVGIAISVTGVMISFNIIHIANFALDVEMTEGEFDAAAFFRNDKNRDNEDIEQFEQELLALKSVDAVRCVFATFMPSDGETYGLLTNRDGEKPEYTKYFANGFNEAQMKELEPLLLEGELDYEALQEGGVIICRSNQYDVYLGGESMERKKQNTDLQVGDTIWIPKEAVSFFYDDSLIASIFNPEDGTINEDQVIYCPVIAVVDYNPYNVNSEVPDVIFSKEFFQEHLVAEDVSDCGLYEILVRCSNSYDIEEVNEFNKENKEYYLTDGGVHETKDAMKGYRQLILLVAGLIAGIGAVNIFNTLSSNIALRKRELQVMNAIGMSRKQILKMLALEGGLSAIFGSLLGIEIGGFVGFWLIMFAKEIFLKLRYQIPWMGILLSILLAIVITLISMLIAKRELKTWDE